MVGLCRAIFHLYFGIMEHTFGIPKTSKQIKPNPNKTLKKVERILKD